jgi:hypothetical protein
MIFRAAPINGSFLTTGLSVASANPSIFRGGAFEDAFIEAADFGSSSSMHLQRRLGSPATIEMAPD